MNCLSMDNLQLHQEEVVTPMESNTNTPDTELIETDTDLLKMNNAETKLDIPEREIPEVNTPLQKDEASVCPKVATYIKCDMLIWDNVMKATQLHINNNVS